MRHAAEETVEVFAKVHVLCNNARISLCGPMAGLYTASKFAARGLTECLYYNLASQNISVSLTCPGLTQCNIDESTLNRPKEFANTADPADPELQKTLQEFHAVGIHPDEVGQKTLKGMKRGDLHIFSHPEFRDEMTDLFNDYVKALPDKPADPRRLVIEDLRRKDRTDSLEKRTGVIAEKIFSS